MAAKLVIGTFATTATIGTTQSSTAFAYSQKKKGDDNSRNGNTITALKCQNKGSASGFDTAVNQECENLICTHPGENATCVQEGAAVTTATTNATSTPKTCAECFTSLLTSDQLSRLGGEDRLCAILATATLTIERFEEGLTSAGVSAPVQAELIQCLLNAGITFATTPG